MLDLRCTSKLAAIFGKGTLQPAYPPTQELSSRQPHVFRTTLPSAIVKMSSHVVVVSPDVKRVSVKVNPGTYMFDVLEEACKKLNLDVDKWSLK